MARHKKKGLESINAEGWMMSYADMVTLLFAPVTIVVMTVYLYDQKVRREGFDLPAA